jgi:hypothetical protein
VVSGDTCLGIALRYGLTLDQLMQANNITDCTFLREGRVLYVPVLATATPTASPTARSTPSPSLPPPWPAPMLLAPSQGQTFTAADTTVSLKWAPVGNLRPGEVYAVHVEDITCSCQRIYQTATSQTQLDVPVNLRPTDGSPHIFNWTVRTVRQVVSSSGGPITYQSVGATSSVGIFNWAGGTPTPTP